MDRETAYVSCIPPEAKEKVTEIWKDRSRKKAEYYLSKELVGIRTFYRTGELEYEMPYRNGVYHGMSYRWYEPGLLTCCEPFQNGKVHGTAYQWGDDGTLLGTYTMQEGTGLDLWWWEWEGAVILKEAYEYRDGARHGFEWHFDLDEALSSEQHWQEWLLHGIERKWNLRGRLHRGFPRYYLRGQRVEKRKYVRACATDPTLPPFRPEDNAPHRDFPPEVAAQLNRNHFQSPLRTKGAQ